ncbi:conjugal transfer protein TraF [Bowmanella sp. Y26]|uniref:thioredoxin family protein n=1 Tax=Bowmanella yangjiangensis TaxID=2811230 RepID=UPI001BDC9B67|nr:thioredoxin domain-containing protein [Bowmanella yangjiangensis]MBT1063346.1 conjugal transfer protein TraF [Bowmanella yangjiangensis]
MREITSYEEFKTLSAERNQLLVYLTASWCGPCKSFSPVMEKVSDAFASILTAVKVDVDKIPEVSADFKVRSVPTLLMVEKGNAVEGMVGNQSYETVSRWLMGNVLVY